MELITSRHLFFNKIKIRRPSLAPREWSVLTICAFIMVLMPWAWGGVVLWATLLTLGLATSALVAAIGDFKTQIIATVLWAVGVGLGFWFVPANTPFGTDPWLNALAFPVAAIFGQLITAWLLHRDIRSRSALDSLGDLIRFPLFWVGLVLFLYFAIQDWNAWGKVVERDLFWRIIKLDHLSWLPNGLRAPLESEERDPGGMNAWRIILTFAGPWMMLCALRVGLRRRRGYISLAWISILTACAVAAYGFTHQPVNWGEVLGYKIPLCSSPFGVFIYRNHAGVYFYLQASLAIALAFWHYRRDQESSSKGGPHLVAIFIAMVLFMAVLLTYSVGALGMALGLVFLITPLAYFIGMPIRAGQSWGSATITLVVVVIALGAMITTSKLTDLQKKLSQKIELATSKGTDNRAPYRQATWEMATAGGASGKVWLGWGAGSFRWASPSFQAAQKELQDKEGKLELRATYAHCDWLQILAEWGVIGMIPLLVGVVYLLMTSASSLIRGTPEAIPLAGVLILFGVHMYMDFICWFTPLLFSLAFIVAAMIAFLDEELRGRKKTKLSLKEIGKINSV